MELICLHCQASLPGTYAYCGYCGHEMGKPCASCHQLNPSNFAFCGHCGGHFEGETVSARPVVALPASAVARINERRDVVVLFCDLCGFTNFSEQHDPEEVARFIHPLFGEIGQLIKQFDGVIEKFIGDAIMAFFGVPLSHEDDPERALLAALDIQRLVHDHAQRAQLPLKMRIGLNTGVVIAGEVRYEAAGSGYTVLGDAINIAARLEQNATPGTILVSESLYDLTKDRFDFESHPDIQAKGKKAPLKAYRLVRLREHGQGKRSQAKFCGRTRLLAQLMQVGKNSHSCRSIGLYGEAGMGKTRLLRESLKRLADQQSLLQVQTFAVSYNQHAGFSLLRQFLKRLLHFDESQGPQQVSVGLQALLEPMTPQHTLTVELLLQLLFPQLAKSGSSSASSQNQLQQQWFIAVSELMQALSRRQPLALVFEDIQWADELSLDWLRFFIRFACDEHLPILVAVTQRGTQPEPKLPLHEWLAVPPLEASACQQLIADHLGLEQLSPPLRPLAERLISHSQQNPFYLEECLLRLQSDGILTQTDQGEWELANILPEDLPLPDSLQRLILSDFDRLDPDVRQLLQSASVAGDDLDPFMLQTLLKWPGEQINQLLQAAQHSRLLVQQGSQYRFRQALVRETIYQTQLHQRRQELHQAFGDHLEQRFEAGLQAVSADLLAYHFVRADNPIKAIPYLYLAARQATAYGGIQEALRSLDKAHKLSLTPELQGEKMLKLDLRGEWISLAHLRHHLLLEKAELLWLIGRYDEAEQLAHSQLTQSTHPMMQASLYLRLGAIQEKRSQWDAALDLYGKGLDALNGLSCIEQAHLLNAQAWSHYRLGAYTQAEDAALAALKLLELFVDIKAIAYSHNVLGVIHYHRNQWQEALHHYQKSHTLQQQIQDLWGQGNSLSNLGSVMLMTNCWQEAEGLFRESLQLREQLGDLTGIATSCNNLGHIYLQQQQWPEAVQVFEQALGLYRQLGNRLGEAVVDCNLGSSYRQQQQWEAASQSLSQGIELLKELGANAILPEAFNELGETYLESAQIGAAALCLSEANQWITDETEALQRGRYDRLCGWLAYLQADYAQAKAALERALKTLEASGQIDERQKLYEQLSKWASHLQWHDRHHWESVNAALQTESPVAETV